MSEYVRIRDCRAARDRCVVRAAGSWKGSTLVVVFLSIAAALAFVGGMAIANAESLESNRRENDLILERLDRIERLLIDRADLRRRINDGQ